MSLVNTASSIIALVIILAGIILLGTHKTAYAGNDKLREGVLERKFDWQYFLIVLLLFILALISRLYLFGAIPGAVNQDSAMAAVDAKALLTYGTDRLGMPFPVYFTAWGHAQMSVLMSYMMIPFFQLWGMNEVTSGLPILIVSMFGIMALYAFSKKIFGKRFSLVILLLLCFNPWHFAQSRWALDANMLPHFFMIGFYFLYKGFYQKKFLYLAMLFFGLSQYGYAVSLYIVPVFLLISCIWLLRKRIVTIGEVIASGCIYLIISLPFFITMIVNTFHLKTIATPFFTIPYIEESARANNVIFFASNKGSQLLTNIKAVFKLIFAQKLDILWDGVPQYGTTFLCMIPFFFLGIYAFLQAFKQEQDIRKRSGYFLLIVYGLTALFSGIITKEVNVNRINMFHYFQIILIAFGIYWLYKQSKYLFAAAISLVILMSGIYVREYFTDYADSFDSYETYSYNFTQAIRELKGRECEVFYITPSSQHASAYQVSEIDTVYIHDLDIGYYMGKTNISGGRELNPYKEQYQYMRAGEIEIDPDFNAVYLINTEDKELFSEEIFHIEQYKQFSVVIPLKYY